MLAETLHGLWRVKALALWIGDATARDVSVFTGSLVILLITLACIGWIPARSARTLVLVGFTWMVLTIAYELALGRFALHLSWAEIASDFDLSHGKPASDRPPDAGVLASSCRATAPPIEWNCPASRGPQV